MQMHNCKWIVEIYFENNNEYVNTKYVCTSVFNYTLLMQSVMQKFCSCIELSSMTHIFILFIFCLTHTGGNCIFQL